MKRAFAAATIVLLLSSIIVVPAFANSAQTYWHGVDSTGVIVFGENCPIEVTKELLTFDISEFPNNHHHETEENTPYTGKVTAEYTFYNPTDLTVTASLAFPFGAQADYYKEPDTEQYDITINGEAISKEIRYTYKPYGGQFDLSEDLSKLSDTYIRDAFYSPAMTVTKYTYIVGGVDKEGLIDKEMYRASNVAFDWDGGDGKSKIYFPEQSGFHIQKDGDVRLGKWADNGDVFSVYVIGQALSTPLVMKCYQDGGVEDKEEIDGIVSLTNTEMMTLEDLALESWSQLTGIPKVDWYNAVIAAFNAGSIGNPSYNCIYLASGGLDMSSGIFAHSYMRWYQYEITIEPHSSITNTVTAPIYPGINAKYDPPIYNYTYLLSPASTWANFGQLEIVINTPFYITENTVDGFTKTDTGYTLKRNGLPEGELEFVLCSSENPVGRISPYLAVGRFIMGIIGATGVGIIISIVVVAAVVIIKNKRKN